MALFSSGTASAPSPTFTEGPWEFIPSTEHHGPYVTTGGNGFGDICDCYTMSNLAAMSVRNGGTSYPIHFQADRADANARLIAAAPDLYAALKEMLAAYWGEGDGNLPEPGCIVRTMQPCRKPSVNEPSLPPR